MERFLGLYSYRPIVLVAFLVAVTKYLTKQTNEQIKPGGKDRGKEGFIFALQFEGMTSWWGKHWWQT